MLSRISLDHEAFAAGCALAGLGLVWLSTRRYGVGMNSDAIAYLAGARHLAAGEGFRLYDGRLLTNFPPLLPAVLALAYRLLAVEPPLGARLLNGLAFGAIVWLAARMFWLQFRALPALAYLGTVTVLLSFPLVHVSVQAWTEPLFIVLELLFLLAMCDYAGKPSPGILARMSVAAGLACLTRYLGVALIATGLVVIVFAPALPLRDRLKHGLLLGASAGLPLVLWCVRNLTVAGVLFGARAGGQVKPAQNLVATFDTLWSWFLPGLSGRYRFFVYALCCLLGSAALVWLVKRQRGSIRITSPVCQSALFFTIYLATLLISSANADVTSANDRFLSPLAVPTYLMVLAFVPIGYAALRKRAPQRVPERLPAALALACVVVWLAYPSLRLAGATLERVRQGAGGYSTTDWQQSETMAYLKSGPFPRDAALYSNRPDGIYVLAGLPAALSPSKKTGYMSQALPDLSTWPGRRPAYLVWFPVGDTRTYLYTLGELQRARTLTLRRRLADGAVYEIGR